MSAVIQPRNLLSADEYLRQERVAEFKSEYVNSASDAMAGATINHNRIAVKLLEKLSSQLSGRPCEVFGSDMKVRIDRANTFRYPDLSGLCGPVNFYDDTADAYRNPTLIVEVLSPSTEKVDRGEKFNLYRLLDSLKEYVLVRQDRIEIEVFTRDAAGRCWTSSLYSDPESTVPLKSLDCTFVLRESYEKVTFT